MTRTILLTFALAACGGKSTTQPTTPAPAASTFELGELSVLDGNDAMLKIHADGSTELGGKDNGKLVYKPGPQLKTDGTIIYNNKPVARVDADGKVTNLEANKVEPITITADKITFDKGSIDLAADGTMSFVGGEGVKPDKAPRVEGADTPGKRRAVLALVALLIGGETKSESHVEEGAGNTVVPVPPQTH